ncbi:MAG: PqqD family protein [Bacteroidetes bacterium]|nr:PqqD family protein [Bacteroidota bacterium]
MANKITLESIVQRKDSQIMASELSDELVMMDMENGNYISLNKTGRIIWEQIEKPIQVKELLQYLIKKYNVEKQQCSNDTLNYLEKINEQNLLSVS